MKKIILIIVIVLIALSATGIFFANKAFDLLFESSISDLKLESEKDIGTAEPSKAPSKAPNKALNDKPVVQIKEETPKETKEAISEVAQNRAIEKNSDKTNTVRDETNSSTEEIPNRSSIPEAETKEVEQPKTSEAKAISQQTIAEVEKKVSVADKSRAIQIVMSKLSAGDISKLEALAKGGMTQAKIAQAKAIVKSRISIQDIQELKQLYYKYAN